MMSSEQLRTPEPPSAETPLVPQDGQVTHIQGQAGVQVRERALPEAQAEYERLAAQIKQAVISRVGKQTIRAFQVEVTPTSIILHGKCQTYDTKQKAQQIAMAVPGYPPLTNLIEVT